MAGKLSKVTIAQHASHMKAKRPHCYPVMQIWSRPRWNHLVSLHCWIFHKIFRNNLHWSILRWGRPANPTHMQLRNQASKTLMTQLHRRRSCSSNQIHHQMMMHRPTQQQLSHHRHPNWRPDMLQPHHHSELLWRKFQRNPLDVAFLVGALAAEMLVPCLS